MLRSLRTKSVFRAISASQSTSKILISFPHAKFSKKDDLASPDLSAPLKADFPTPEEILDTANKNSSSVNLDDVNLYDELKDTTFDEGEDRQSKTKNLSLKLLDTKTPEQVLKIFESDIIRGEQGTVYGEELVMILKFLQHNLKSSMDREDA